MRNLERYLSEKISIEEYYKTYIMNIVEYATKKDGEKFLKNYKAGFGSNKLAICPLHPDSDPSFGTFKGKDGLELYHCLGCGATGKVVRLHQRMINLRKIDIGLQSGVNITYEEAARHLATSSGIDISSIQEDKTDYNNAYIQKQIVLRKSMEKYSIREFNRDVLALRLGDYSVQNKKILLNRYIVNYMLSNMGKDR